MHVSIIAIVLVLVSAASIEVRAQSAAASADEVMTIDGTKHPELVPQWTIWESAFRYLAKDDTEQLPTVVLTAITHEQAIALMKDAHGAEFFNRECSLRALQAGRNLLAEKPDIGLEAANDKVVAASMSCRRHTLDARDKVLASLPPNGAAALAGWVESLKAGWTTTVKKSHLRTYLLPE